MPRIVALDESGTFENIQNKTSLKFIGGYLCDTDDKAAEAVKIKNLLTSACRHLSDKLKDNHRLKEFCVVYPNSLHSGTNTYLLRKDPTDPSKWIDPFKKQSSDKNIIQAQNECKSYLFEKIKEYMDNNHYTFFAFFYPNEESGYIESSGNTNLLDPAVASNLYERMATLALFNHAFYCPEDPCAEYDFRIATRKMPADSDDYKNMYDTFEGNRNNELVANVTNTSTYKTAFSTMLYEKNKDAQSQNVSYYFHANAINYKNGENDEMAFLYLADFACSYILDYIRNKMENEELPEAFLAMSKLGYQIRVYGEPDQIFRNMTDCIRNVQIAEYFALQYDLYHIKDAYQQLYTEHWLLKLNAYLKKRFETGEEYRRQFYIRLPQFYAQVENYMGKVEISYEKGMHIAGELLKYVNMLDDSDEFPEKRKYIFRLNDIQLRGASHRGAVNTAKTYIKKCEVYKNYVDVEEYIAHSIRVLNIYFNAMEYQQVIDDSIGMLKLVTQMKKVYEQMRDKSESFVSNPNASEDTSYVLAGKLCSMIGQAYAFQKDFTHSRKYFEKALQEYPNDADNYNITFSYYLHMIITQGEKSLYKRDAITYFGAKKSLNEQLEYALQKDDYTLFVFVKAFRCFYAADQSNWPVLQTLIREADNRFAEGKTCFHPWELIYKNLCESVAIMDGGPEKSKEYDDLKTKALTCIKVKDSTISMIQTAFEAKALNESNTASNDKKSAFFNKKKRDILDSGCFEQEKGEMTSFAKMLDVFQKKITYMYE